MLKGVFKCYFMAKRGPKKLEVKINKTAAKVKKAAVDESAESAEKAEKAEKEKLMFMRVGVVCFMVIFFVAWIFNLKYQFKINSNNNSKSSFNWEQTKAELDKAMAQVKEGLAQIKQAREQVQNTLPRQPQLTSEQIDLLKGKLMNEIATGTASSTKK